MSLPVEEIACEKENGEVRLRDVVYNDLIEKYFDQASCAAVAQSGFLDGFSPLYNTSRLKLLNPFKLFMACVIENVF